MKQASVVNREMSNVMIFEYTSISRTILEVGRINVPTCFDNPVLVHTVPIKGPFLFLLLLYNNIIILVVSMKLQFTTSC